jgi:hypothetical protein
MEQAVAAALLGAGVALQFMVLGAIWILLKYIWKKLFPGQDAEQHKGMKGQGNLSQAAAKEQITLNQEIKKIDLDQEEILSDDDENSLNRTIPSNSETISTSQSSKSEALKVFPSGYMAELTERKRIIDGWPRINASMTIYEDSVSLQVRSICNEYYNIDEFREGLIFFGLNGTPSSRSKANSFPNFPRIIRDELIRAKEIVDRWPGNDTWMKINYDSVTLVVESSDHVIYDIDEFRQLMKFYGFDY